MSLIKVHFSRHCKSDGSRGFISGIWSCTCLRLLCFVIPQRDHKPERACRFFLLKTRTTLLLPFGELVDVAFHKWNPQNKRIQASLLGIPRCCLHDRTILCKTAAVNLSQLRTAFISWDAIEPDKKECEVHVYSLYPIISNFLFLSTTMLALMQSVPISYFDLNVSCSAQ